MRVRVQGEVTTAVAAFQGAAPTPTTVDNSYLTLDHIFLSYMQARDSREGTP